MSQESLDEYLVADMARFYADPLGFVLYAYDWDNDPALQIVKLPEEYRDRYNSTYGPDKWACDYLAELGQHVRKRGFNGVEPVMPIRMATASGHGIGKSALTAWLVDWIMSTRPFCKGTITANTAEQLSSKTWAEIAKWTKKCITGHWFDITTSKGHMRMQHKQHVGTGKWFCSAQTCREENSESFAGQHAVDSTSFYLFDEASAVPEKIYEVAEGGLATGEPMFFLFGNPTQNSGAFHKCFNQMQHRWSTRQIDSRTVSITNKNQIKEWIDDYGLDSDFVKVRVRGMFPSMSSKQFISVEDAEAGRMRILRDEQFMFAPKILTCDPAWEGDDDLTIGLRQGLHFEILRTIPKNDNDIQIARILANYEDEHQADAVFVDGGFGTGIISAGREMGRNWTIVWFSGKSTDLGYLNKRAEMWGAVRDWLKSGGSYGKDDALYTELIAPEMIVRDDGKMQLESKADLKKRGYKSPNRADALALSFAYPVAPRRKMRQQSAMNYDPLETSHSFIVSKNNDYDPLNNM